ncbi:hypothetical protein LCGC14_2513080, partial [marine sediment metagenome]
MTRIIIISKSVNTPRNCGVIKVVVIVSKKPMIWAATRLPVILPIPPTITT